VTWRFATKRLRTAGEPDDGPASSRGTAGVRLTSTTLHRVVAPPWRVVLEVPAERLGGVEHVLIGPPGIYAVSTVLAPLPDSTIDDTPASAEELAASAILRAELDDVLATCAMSSDARVVIHWGRTESDQRAVDAGHTTIAVDGNRLADWMGTLEQRRLSQQQVDLAWQTVCLAIGRPDPLDAAV